MKFKSIGYGETRNIGNYENARIYAEIEVPEGEDPEQSLNSLRAWARGELNQHNELQELSRRKTDLENDCYALQVQRDIFLQRWNVLEETWNKAVALLEHHGVRVTAQLPSLPYLHSIQSNSDEGVVEEVSF